MTDQAHPNPEHLALGTLIRAEADGELSAEQCEQLDAARARCADLDRRIAFERSLRLGVAQAMGSVATPPDLASRVRQAIAAEQELGGRLEERAAATRLRHFWTGRRLGSLVAAGVVLALGLTLLTQAVSVTSRRLNSVQQAYRQELAGFVAREHGRCCADVEAARRKFRFTQRDQAAEALSDLLGQGVSLPCPKAHPDVRFDGAGPCGLPGRGPSAHVMYEPPIGPKVSIFMKPDSGELPFEPGKTYLLDTKACGVAGIRIVGWVDEGIVYYAVFEEGPGCEQIFAELGIPTPSVKF
ncbi:MAG: hypothetical protein Kow0022_10560 [Phycisphaerales bacterium]